MRLRLPTVMLVLAALSTARSASAEECTEFKAPDKTDADAVNKEAAAKDDAVKLANEKLPGDPEAALTAFNMALSLPTHRCNPEVLVQVAAVREAMNQPSAAWDLYHLIESIKLISPAKQPADNPSRTAIQKASTAAIRVAQKVGIARLLVTGADVARGFAKIDGADWGDLKRLRALAPGKHTILVGVTGEGFRTITREIVAKAGTVLDPIEVKTEDLEILAPRPADLDDPSRADARSKFDAGTALAAQGTGHWDAAYKAFKASQGAYRHQYAEYNGAVCAQRLGQLILARRGFTTVAKGEGTPGLAAWVVERAKRNIKAIDEQVGRVILHLHQPGASVTVDNGPLEEIPSTGDRRTFIPSAAPMLLDGAMPGDLEILLDPGQKHHFVISKPGFETDPFDVEPSPGKAVAFERPLRTGSRLARNIGLITMASGVGVLLAGVAVGTVGDGEIKTLTDKKLCRVDKGMKPVCVDSAAVAQYTVGNTKAAIGNVLLPVGGAVAAGGALAALIGWAPWATSGGSLAKAVTPPAISLGVNALFVTGTFQ